MRILFFASYPDQPIGYSKVAHALSHWLSTKQGVEFYYFGIGNYEEGRCRERGPPPGAHMIDVNAVATDPFGIDILAQTMEQLKPDLFLIYNDIIVTCRAFNALLEYRAKNPQTRFVSYIDLVYPFEKLAFLRHLDRNTDQILVFSDCWRRNLLKVGIKAEKIQVLPHGISVAPVDRRVARAHFGFAADDFVLLNANRNTYRKAQDLTIRAFVEFLIHESWDPRIKLFLHCEKSTRSGYTLLDVLEVEASRAGVDVAALQARILTFPTSHVSDYEITLLYNACDVGLNTCMGEGFGLCNVEHAALGRPQIVSAVGAFPDIFAEGGAILIEPRTWIRAATALDEHSGDLGISSATDFAVAMSTYFHDREKRERDGMWGATVLPERYRWDRILPTLQVS